MRSGVTCGGDAGQAGNIRISFAAGDLRLEGVKGVADGSVMAGNLNATAFGIARG
jgi:hypothetical protein